jgi:hypothetical protein
MRGVDKRWRERNAVKLKEKNSKQYKENPGTLKNLRIEMKKDGRYKKMHARYYAGAEQAKWRGEAWGVVEECMVMERTMSDHDLAEKLGRSVRAIQIKRCKLNKQNLLESI